MTIIAEKKGELKIKNEKLKSKNGSGALPVYHDNIFRVQLVYQCS
jgi:hypothetical protein